MIIVRLFGGLGNQMFQYAAGRHLARINGTVLKLDVSGFGDDELREYALEPFCIREEFAAPEEVACLTTARQTAFGRMVHGLLHNHPKRPRSYIRRKSPCFEPSILNLGDNVYLEGYWQSEKFFEASADVIRREFAFRGEQTGRNRELAGEIDAAEAVSVHVRRGDYVSDPKANQTHGTCGLEYYLASVEYVARFAENPHFFIFSDDPAWCRDNLNLPYPTTIVDHDGLGCGHEDMRLMSQCRHHIVANSSFSWWGAWLNPGADKIVCAPKKWFATDKYSTDGIIPERWIRM
ncbi:MAG: alpha-1,2-fucosyltransferase [Planctomycetes bacterium]|nr:alpha-1,2-fucosyltransferase [Planctomycetota bacterium]